MKQALKVATAALLSRTPLGLWPMRVRCGFAAGARWTLYPWTSYWRGTHEPSVQAALFALGNGNIQGWSCWDLGAHFGLYSVGLARRVGPTGQVAAFEPNPQSFARLQYHAHLNQLSNLRLYQAAASEEMGRAELFTYGDLNTTTTHLPYEGETRSPQVMPIAVSTLRLDTLVERGELRLPQFIKIDVEGHGHRALRGMSATIARAYPTLLIGLHSPQEIEGIRALLDPLGYQSRALDPSGNPDPQVGTDRLFIPPH